MSRKRHSAEDIVKKLQQADVGTADRSDDGSIPRSLIRHPACGEHYCE